MPTYETVSFDFWFDCEWWNTPPSIEILLDQEKIAYLNIEQEQQISLTAHCDFGLHCLTIIRSGKTDAETRANLDGGYDTQTLHLKKLCIDRIDVRNLVWSRSTWAPEYPEPWFSQQIANHCRPEAVVIGETTLGHNGTWRFEFQSPFYQFMIDCVRGKK